MESFLTTVCKLIREKELPALKLHAINQPARENISQDWSDMFALVKANKLPQPLERTVLPSVPHRPLVAVETVVS